MEVKKLSFGRLLAILALVGWMSVDLIAQEARFYQKTSYQGKYETCREGDYDYRKFEKHFYYNGRRQEYCSVKIPKGYCLYVDYYGRGWNYRGVKKYESSVNKLKTGWKKVRLVPCGGGHNDHHAGGGHGKGCDDWYVQFYKDSNYRGDYDCYKGGEHHYKFKWGGYAKSFKLKKGWELHCYYRGRLVKKYTKGYGSYSGRYDKFKLVKAGHHDDHAGGGHGKGCDNWYVQFYKDSNYRGDYDCYTGGEHPYKFKWGGYAKSFKLKKGWELHCYYRGRLVKKYSKGYGSYSGRYDKFKLVKASYGGGHHDEHEPEGCDNWYVQFYEHGNYGGKYHCLEGGKHKYRFYWGGYPKSFKLKRGWELHCYYQNKLVKKYARGASSYSGRYDYVEIVKTGSSGGHSGGRHETKKGCEDWYVQWYSSNSYKGEYHCFDQGHHRYRFDFGSSPKSCKVKRGYAVVCYYRGKEVKRYTSSTARCYPGRYDYFDVVKLSDLRRN